MIQDVLEHALELSCIFLLETCFKSINYDVFIIDFKYESFSRKLKMFAAVSMEKNQDLLHKKVKVVEWIETMNVKPQCCAADDNEDMSVLSEIEAKK